MSASILSSASAARLAVPVRAVPSRTAVLRAVIVTGCVAAVTAAALLGRPDAYLRADADLARLLRGMALIKGAIALAALGVLLWRCAWPLPMRIGAAYVGGMWLLAGASVLIWQLTAIGAAAAAFHLGAFAMLVAAWRDHGRDDAPLRRGAPR